MANVTIKNILAVVQAEKESREGLKGTWAKWGKPEKDYENMGFISALENVVMMCANPDYLSDLSRLYGIELPDN